MLLVIKTETAQTKILGIEDIPRIFFPEIATRSAVGSCKRIENETVVE